MGQFLSQFNLKIQQFNLHSFNTSWLASFNKRLKIILLVYNFYLILFN